MITFSEHNCTADEPTLPLLQSGFQGGMSINLSATTKMQIPGTIPVPVPFPVPVPQSYYPTLSFSDIMDGMVVGSGLLIDDGKTICVPASYVDDTDILYVCPFCWNRLTKNGHVPATAYHVEHQHGSDGNRHRRVESRSLYCLEIKELRVNVDERMKLPNNVYIYITKNTVGSIE